MIVFLCILGWILPIILFYLVKYWRLPKNSTVGDLFEEDCEDPPTIALFIPAINVFILILYMMLGVYESLTEGDISKIKIK